ncbi:hypothetical protein BOQ63_006875 (plasmid) [Streptomyces viridifaciens]|uniref:hypothetical protein n=1 Tax=Kitasatospora aureofaciens TaxID=1894 RepID=UPI000AF8B7B8|nr:hypothetical protein [Kitasatospora aureofaciens]UKZ03797.1 hypothetical protein BOQ63_006875 [Streptomyces viridifaciens]
MPRARHPRRRPPRRRQDSPDHKLAGRSGAQHDDGRDRAENGDQDGGHAPDAP